MSTYKCTCCGTDNITSGNHHIVFLGRFITYETCKTCGHHFELKLHQTYPLSAQHSAELNLVIEDSKKNLAPTRPKRVSSLKSPGIIPQNPIVSETISEKPKEEAGIIQQILLGIFVILVCFGVLYKVVDLYQQFFPKEEIITKTQRPVVAAVTSDFNSQQARSQPPIQDNLTNVTTTNSAQYDIPDAPIEEYTNTEDDRKSCNNAYLSADQASTYANRAYYSETLEDVQWYLKKTMYEFEQAKVYADACECKLAAAAADQGYSYAKKGNWESNYDDAVDYARKAKAQAEEIKNYATNCDNR